MPADQAELHHRAVEEFGRRVQAVGDDQWELPTPCSDWNVRQLVNHLVYENRWTVPLIGGSTIAEVGDRYEGDLLGEAPKAAWDESSAEAVRAVGADGALERGVDLSSGPTPGWSTPAPPGSPPWRSSTGPSGPSAPGPTSRPAPTPRPPCWPRSAAPPEPGYQPPPTYAPATSAGTWSPSSIRFTRTGLPPPLDHQVLIEWSSWRPKSR